jgi:hypothetical protein
MRELHILLQRHRDNTVKLLPLLYFDDFREFGLCVADYEGCRCSSGGCRCHKRLWAEDLRRLQAVTMIRKDKVCLFVAQQLHMWPSEPTLVPSQQRDPELVRKVVASVVGHLREMGGLRDPGQRPVAVRRDEQVRGLVEAMRGGKWVWLHGTGAQLWQLGPRCAPLISRVLPQGVSARARSQKRCSTICWWPAQCRGRRC